MVGGNVLHMNIGDGESSYANNSLLQENVIRKSLPILRQAIKGMVDHDVMFSRCFVIADMGCSSGNNTLLVASNIIDIVIELCRENNRQAPQFQVCLNDLFGNDFNNIFKLLPDFYAKLKTEKGENFGPCFVSAVPGSFHDRLFPDHSLHIVHSSSSVHWLSQVPEGLEINGVNIYMAKTSPPYVFQAYARQFHTDFTKFLQMRSEEIVQGGCMFLAFVGRSIADPTSDDSCILWELLSQSLLDMVKEGLVQESDIKSFNIPIYYPCEDEVRKIIQDEGSFCVDSLNVFEVNWDPCDTDYTKVKGSSNGLQSMSHISHGENAVKILRAVIEPLLTSHFGYSIIEGVFKSYNKHVAEHLAKTKAGYFNIVISLTKK